MRSLLTLLFLLMLPALLMPVGATLCVCVLMGEVQGEGCRSSCCRECCSEPEPGPSVPAFRALAERDCCVSFPDATTISPKPAKRLAERPGSADDLRVEAVPPPVVAIAPRRVAARGDARWRDQRLHPPPLCVRCSPLLL